MSSVEALAYHGTDTMIKAAIVRPFFLSGRRQAIEPQRRLKLLQMVDLPARLRTRVGNISQNTYRHIINALRSGDRLRVNVL